MTHFQSAGGNTTGIGRLRRAKQHVSGEQYIDRAGSGGHICPFRYHSAAVGHQGSCFRFIDLVLGGGRERRLGGNVPRVCPSGKLHAKLVGVFLDPTPLHVLELQHPLQFLLSDSLRIVDKPGGVRQRDRFGAQFQEFSHRILRHVTTTGDKAGLSCN